jgi:uncharacterized membrane protein
VIPSKSDFNDVKEAVFEMISEKGKMFDSAIDRLKTDVDRFKAEMINRDSIHMDTKLKDILKEIKEIKSQLPKEPKQTTSEIQERGNGDVKTKEDSVKNLWARIFHKGRIS